MIICLKGLLSVHKMQDQWRDLGGFDLFPITTGVTFTDYSQICQGNLI